MKKIVVLAMVGLLALGLLGPASAKKKKPKKPPAPAPVEVQYFLHTDADCEALSLTLVDGEDPSDCFFGVDDTFNEHPEAQPVFGDPVDSYVASEGLPLKLDVSRKVTGSLTIRGYYPTVNGIGVVMLGVGDAVVDLTLVGTIAGEEKELGTFSHSYTAGPNHIEQVDFEIPLDASLDGATVEALTFKVFTHGDVIGGRGIEHDSEVPPSIKVPALQ